MEELKLKVVQLENSLKDQNIEIKHLKLLIQQLFSIVGNDTSAVDAKISTASMGSVTAISSTITTHSDPIADDNVPILAKIQSKRKNAAPAKFQGKKRKKFRALHAVFMEQICSIVFYLLGIYVGERLNSFNPH